MIQGRQNRCVAILFCGALACLCAFGGGYNSWREYYFSKGSAQTAGVVISGELKLDRFYAPHCTRSRNQFFRLFQSTYCWKAQIQFRDSENKTWIATKWENRYIGPVKYKVGRTHNVWFATHNPSDNFIGSSFDYQQRSWFVARLIFFPAALIFAALTAWFYFVSDDRDFKDAPGLNSLD